MCCSSSSFKLLGLLSELLSVDTRKQYAAGRGAEAGFNDGRLPVAATAAATSTCPATGHVQQGLHHTNLLLLPASVLDGSKALESVSKRCAYAQTSRNRWLGLLCCVVELASHHTWWEVSGQGSVLIVQAAGMR